MKYSITDTKTFFGHRVCLLVVGCSLLVVLGDICPLKGQEIDKAVPEAKAAAVAAEPPDGGEMADVPPDKDPQAVNLLGQQVNKDPEVEVPEPGNARPADPRTRERVANLIERTVQLAGQVDAAASELETTSNQLAQKQTELTQLPTQLDAVYSTGINTSVKIAELRSAGVLFLSDDNPSKQKYKRLLLAERQLDAQFRLLKQQQRSLPLQVRNLSSQKATLQNKVRQELPVEIVSLLTSWDAMLSIVQWMPTSEAADIVSQCQATLDRYPNLTLIRLMKGFGHLHLGQQATATAEFSAVLKAMQGSNDLARAVRKRALLGSAWCAIQQSEHALAGKHLAQAAKLDSSDYELSLCRAELLRSREFHSQALVQYRRATSLKKKHSAAYRLAAGLVLETEVRPVATAVRLATVACQYDDTQDWRNHLVLGRAYRAAGNETEAESAFDSARQHADTEAKSEIDQILAGAR